MSISARKAKGTRIRDSRGDRVFTVVNYIILTLFGLAALYPLIYVLSASISEPLAVNSGRMKLWPVGFNIEGYKSILSNKWILTGYGNSLFYTVVGTFLNVLVTFMASYSLSRKDMYGHGLITFFMVFTMWFGGGLIPTFLVVKKLGLVNTRMVLLLLGLVSVYNCIICRSFPMNCRRPRASTAATISRSSGASSSPCPAPCWPSWRCTTLWGTGTATSTP